MSDSLKLSDLSHSVLDIIRHSYETFIHTNAIQSRDDHGLTCYNFTAETGIGEDYCNDENHQPGAPFYPLYKILFTKHDVQLGKNKYQAKIYIRGGKRRNNGRDFYVRVASVKALFALSGVNTDDKTMTTSHLCHNISCHNPLHLAWEALAVNKSRNGCPGGGNGCLHTPPCLRPGPEAVSVGVPYTVISGLHFVV